MTKSKKKTVLSESERLEKLPKNLTYLFNNNAFEEKEVASHLDENGHYCFVADFLKSPQYQQYKEDDFHKVLKAPAANTNSDTPESFILKKIKGHLAVVHVQKDSLFTSDNKLIEENKDKGVKEDKKEEVKMNEVESADEVDDKTTTGQEAHQNNDGQSQSSKKKKKKKNKKCKSEVAEEEMDNEEVKQEEAFKNSATAVPAAAAVNDEGDAADDDANWKNSSTKKSKDKKKDKKKDDGKTSKEGKTASGGKETSGEEEKSRTNVEKPDKSQKNNSSNRNEQKRQNTSAVDNSKKMKPDSLESGSKKEESQGVRKNSTELKASSKDSLKDPAKRLDRIERILTFAFQRGGIAEKQVTVNQDESVWLNELLEKCNGSMFAVDEVVGFVRDVKSSDYSCTENNGAFYIRFVGKKEPEKPTAAGAAASSTGNTQASYAGNTSDGGNWNKRGPYQQKSRESEDDFFLSKTMSYLLRHGAAKQRLPIGQDGYMFVMDLLGFKEFKGYYKEEDVVRVVQNNDKQRFQLTRDATTEALKVRANQGHSLEVKDLELTPVKSPADIPTVIHGTSLDAWSKIKTEGLKCMKRNHMHFARGEPGENGVISGMRSTCEVMIYVDAERAMKDGYEFFISANGVILCSGNKDGILPAKYFKEVVQRKPRQKLL